MRKGLLAAVALCAVVTGCQTLSPPLARVNCNSGSCSIPVHVDNCVISAPDVDVYGQSRNLFWEIDRESAAAGYEFPQVAQALGVWIKDDPKGEFDQPDRQTKTKFKLHDKNSDAGRGTYRYGVRVVKGATRCPDLDPSIVNH
jgi:hypothetical protein